VSLLLIKRIEKNDNFKFQIITFKIGKIMIMMKIIRFNVITTNAT